MTFEIGQIFEGDYPPEVAYWCNETQKAHIVEIESLDDVRRFKVVSVPEPDDEEIAVQVRSERDRKIAATDYLAMPDYPLGEEDRAVVLSYRQALRDIPAQEGFPRDVVWPNEPAALIRSR